MSEKTDVLGFCSQGELFRIKRHDTMGGSPGDVSEDPVTQEKRKKGQRTSCDVGEATEGLENER